MTLPPCEIALLSFMKPVCTVHAHTEPNTAQTHRNDVLHTARMNTDCIMPFETYDKTETFS